MITESALFMNNSFQIRLLPHFDVQLTTNDLELSYLYNDFCHYSEAIMSVTASQITCVSSVCSTVCSSAYHRWPVYSLYKEQITRKMFPFDDANMWRRFQNKQHFNVYVCIHTGTKLIVIATNITNAKSSSADGMTTCLEMFFASKWRRSYTATLRVLKINVRCTARYWYQPFKLWINTTLNCE